MKKFILVCFCFVNFYQISHAQFTICERCGEQRNGNTLIIQGTNKGNWTVNYNIIGHKTTFITPTNEEITLKDSGEKSENPDGTTTRHTMSENGVWRVEIHYKGHSFVKAILTKTN
jgi:hypothetical protein